MENGLPLGINVLFPVIYSDLAVAKVLGLHTWFIYYHLRTHLRREKFSEMIDPEARRLAETLHLVAHVGTKTLAEECGMSRATYHRHVKILEEIGWIKVIQSDPQAANTYVLGRVTGWGVNGKALFYADAMVAQVRKALIGAGVAMGHWASAGAAQYGRLRQFSVAARSGALQSAVDHARVTVGPQIAAGTYAWPTIESMRAFAEEWEDEVRADSQPEPEEGSPLAQVGEAVPETPMSPVVTGPPIPPLSTCDTEGGSPDQRKKDLLQDMDPEPSQSCSLSSPPLPLDGKKETQIEPQSPQPPLPQPTRVSEATDGDVVALAQKLKAAKREQSTAELDASTAKARKTANLKGAPVPATRSVVLDRLHGEWTVLFKRIVGEKVPVAQWGIAERKMVERLVFGDRGMKGYGEEAISVAFDYLLTFWSAISGRFFKGTAVLPSLAMLVKLHGSLVPEAGYAAHLHAQFREARKVADAAEASRKAGAYVPPPRAVMDEGQKAQEALAKLGISVKW